MTSIRPFEAVDIFKFNSTNLDPLTETYDLNFYFSYLARWPNLFTVAEGRDGTIDAYSKYSPFTSHDPKYSNLCLTCFLVMGKLESSPSYYQFSEHYLPWHAHITALTVAPHARRLGLARILSQSFERAGDENDAWFVDLFVRQSNEIAQALYKGLGYSVYRRVLDYYVDDPEKVDVHAEDAYDMRKPLKRDKNKKHVRERGEDFAVDPSDVW
jgi:N-terminal acetyltransferase B complex catalytic subunit